MTLHQMVSLFFQGKDNKKQNIQLLNFFIIFYMEMSIYKRYLKQRKDVNYGHEQKRI